MKIEFGRLAAVETREAVAWYELRRRGLGREFRLAVHVLLMGIAENPQRWPLYHRQVRRAVTARFPYVVYYQLNGAVICILRVVHGSRDPGPIRELLP